MTSGAFHLEEQLNNGFLLRANNNYWQPPGIDQIHIIFHANSDEALNAYDAGEVRIMGSQQTSVPNKGFTYPDLNKPNQSSGIRYPGFTHTKPPFDDPQARLVVAHAINRDELIKTIGGGPVRPRALFHQESHIHHKASIFRLVSILIRRSNCSME